MLGILATDRNFGIAKEGRIPWNFPADLRFYQAMTTNRINWVSRTTFESLPEAVRTDPKRAYKILTSKPQDEFEYSFNQVNPSILSNDHILIGGLKAYDELLLKCSCVFHTLIASNRDCDQFLNNEATLDWFPHRMCLLQTSSFAIDVYYKHSASIPEDTLAKIASLQPLISFSRQLT